MKKIAIVGVEGSGKTVLMAAMGDKYKSPDANGYFMMPQNHETFAFYTRESDRMRNGAWPQATSTGEFRRLEWSLLRKKSERSTPEHICEITFADFAGEIYRMAFGNESQGRRSPSDEESITQVTEHVFSSDVLIVLVNLADVINGSYSDTRTIEMLWLTQDMLRLAYKNGKRRNIALVFTQADAYSETISACGGLRGVLSKYLPQVYAGSSNNISLFAVSAVSKTIPGPDGSGIFVPAANFCSEGLEQIVKWVVTTATFDSSRRRFAWGIGLSLCVAVFASGAYLWYANQREKEETMRSRNQASRAFLTAFEEKRYQDAAAYIDNMSTDAADVQVALGNMYKYGYGVKRDKKLAVQYYRLAAESGNAEGQRLLGDCYTYGVYESGIEEDENEGFQWYLKSADNGDVKAQMIVGRKYCAEHRKMLYAHRLARLKKKDAISLNNAEIKRLFDVATHYLTLAIENGEVNAYSLLGDMEFDSARWDWWGDNEYDVSKDVYKEAENYYFVAATNGYRFAQRKLGEIYAKGLSGEKDIERAKKWYKMAADQGDDDAMKALKQLK